MNVRIGGARLKVERMSLGYTQLQVAERIGRNEQGGYIVNQQQLSKIEEGRVMDPGFRVLCLVGRVYGLTPNDIADVFGVFADVGGASPPNQH